MTQGKMKLEDYLDDLCVRFIINLPREDLSSVERICFQIEEAQWFYEDFIRPLDPSLPSMSLRTFSLKMFQHCPLLASFSIESHTKAFEEFLQYKTRVPVRGAIMLNDTMDAAVLVRGYRKGSRWSFPRGKINKDEDDLDCAIREVYEETGYDLRVAGLVGKNEPVYPLEVTMHDQQVRLYVFRGVPENTIFETKTRKEIGGIKWYKVEELPAYRKKRGAGKANRAGSPSHEKFYMVAPFMVQLRQWVLKQKKSDQDRVGESISHHHPQPLYEDNPTDDNIHDSYKASPGLEAHSDFMDSATKELHRLLRIRPPTQGLQILSPTSDQQTGQTLMSLLQPRFEGDEETPRRAQGAVPDNLFDLLSSGGSTAQAPHPYQPEQRMPMPNYGVAPQFPGEGNVNASYVSQHRSRPFVNVSTDMPHPPAFAEQPHQFQNRPVQLVHPQPLPPQVQKAMLLRDMVGSPQTGEPAVNRSEPSGLPRENQYAPQGRQAYHNNPQFAQTEGQSPVQLPTHPANLLNVLRGNSAQRDANQRLGPESPRQVMGMSAEQQHPHQPAPGNGFASQYGASIMPSTYNNVAVNSNHVAPSSQRPMRPTDKHRAGLLDMFKKTDSLSQVQVDGQGGSRRSSQFSEVEKRQWPSQSPTTANALRSAAQENGRPIQMNPETNLPFGALTILSRPQPGKSPSEHTTTSVRSRTDVAQYGSIGSQPSPRASFNGASPAANNTSPLPHQILLHKTQQLNHLSAKTYTAPSQSYPYGNATQGGQPNSLSMFANPPAASALPMPGSGQFRQDSTAEHRNNLLSLFGKPKTNVEPGKGKGVSMGDQYGPGIGPLARLGSVASSGGAEVSGSLPNASRRGSHSPLSPEDRDFLLNFLESASSGAKR